MPEENVDSPSKRARSSEPPEPEAESQLSTYSVDEEFRCAICLEILTAPYAIIPCLHTFDKECLTAWWKGYNNCPTCKKVSTSAKSAFQLKSIMDHVHKKRRKMASPPDNDNTEIYPCGGGGGDDYGYDDDDDDGGSQLEYSPGENLVWPCDACPPNNVLGYTCIVPISEPTDLEKRMETERRGVNATPVGPPLRGELRASLSEPMAISKPGVTEHKQCVKCTKYIPRSFPGPVKCANCTKYFCQNFDPLGCPNTNVWDVLRARSDVKLYNYNVQTLALDCLPPNLKRNRHEVARLVDYLNARALSVDDVLAQLFLMKHAEAVEDLNDQEAEESWGPNAHFCSQCVFTVACSMLFKWWCSERKRSIDGNEGVVIVKPDCWYGVDCRTQTHNDGHGERYNHTCLNARPSAA